MDIKNILTKVDHTLLKVDANFEEIKALCEDAISFGVASVCIPPCFVKSVKDYVGNRIKICTVVGFPNGYNTTATKVFEAVDALENGADEIDVVINIGDVKSHNYYAVKEELRTIREATKGYCLKVIIEACLLTNEEKIEMCKIVTEVKADFIKTSTGFSTGGATKEDVVLFKRNVGSNVKIKAAGGIKSLLDAEAFVELGCDRLGTSKVVSAVKSFEV